MTRFIFPLALCAAATFDNTIQFHSLCDCHSIRIGLHCSGAISFSQECSELNIGVLRDDARRMSGPDRPPRGIDRASRSGQSAGGCEGSIIRPIVPVARTRARRGWPRVRRGREHGAGGHGCGMGEAGAAWARRGTTVARASSDRRACVPQRPRPWNITAIFHGALNIGVIFNGRGIE